jgi:hypothetical protein
MSWIGLFLSNISITDDTAETIVVAVTELCVSLGISVKYLVGRGSDGASDTKKSGVVRRHEELTPNLVSVHCLA